MIELEPYPVSINGQEQVTIDTPEIGGGVTSESTFSFGLKTAVNLSENLQAAETVAQRIHSGLVGFPWQPDRPDQRTEHLVNVEGTTMAEQLSALDQLLAEGLGGSAAEVQVLEKIVALIKEDDASVAVIIDRLAQKSGAFDNEVSSALIGMLGAAGTAKSQETLIGIASAEDWPLACREMALFSSAQITEPVAELDTWLQAMHERNDELSDSSLLILAAMGDRVRVTDPKRFQEISQYILAAAGAEQADINSRIVGLDAVANLGPEKVPEFVSQALQSEDPLVREKAVLSLLRTPDESAGFIIGQVLENDSADSVRSAAATLLADPKWLDALTLLTRAAVNDASPLVRIAAAQSLGQWCELNPEAQATLEHLANQDASEEVRSTANEVLNSHIAFVVKK